ncbi:GMC oxidoreductase [Streptomyces pilosus]|uniref:Cholesterol oxidase n=1 Tax=Streptomyces pilosus TaxID=28893 RepID=A0A918F5I2_9ACTN|nr:GMC oxidoreductase [Streptomyces pilosus]GGR06474.1 cholesterol oxidase [Streptomyces pilosus]GGV68978.1 cholesterol oxidase [Streptomyces pilosus]
MERQQHRADVVIVGSGYGGSIAALGLAEAGIDAVVLERGRRWPVTDAGDTFATQTAPDGRAAWLSETSPLTDAKLDVYTGVLEFVEGSGMNVLAGTGVGGASLASNGTMCEPSAALFRRTLGDVLDHREMSGRWYPEARELIGCSPIPDDVYESGFYRSARSFADQLDKAGIPWEKVDLAVDWDVVREEMAGTRVRSQIDGLNVFGVNSGAQRSLDRTLLARAEASGHITVRPLSVVTAVRPAGGDGDGFHVDYESIDERGTVRSLHRITTTRLVLAAGTLGTNRLLLRARESGALPALHHALGTRVGNSEVITARTGMAENNPRQGGPAAIFARDWEDNPLGPVSLLNFPWPDAPAEEGWITTIGAVPAPALGTFRYDQEKDDVVLHWPAGDPALARAQSAITHTLDRLNEANPGSRTAFSRIGTTGGNVVGGVPLGTVTDDAGRVGGHPGLYVVDGSLLPGTGVPPALTVAAVAARLTSLLVRELVGTR